MHIVPVPTTEGHRVLNVRRVPGTDGHILRHSQSFEGQGHLDSVCRIGEDTHRQGGERSKGGASSPFSGPLCGLEGSLLNENMACAHPLEHPASSSSVGRPAA